MAFGKKLDKENENLEEELKEEEENLEEDSKEEPTKDQNQEEEKEEKEKTEEIESDLDNGELILKLTRMQADYSNLKRRTEIEMKKSIDYGIETLACELLPVLDNFERALEAEEDKENGFYKGVEMIYNQLIETLNKMDIEEIDALDCTFDPNCHNAVMVEESEDHDSDIVTGVLQKGYKLKDKVIRPSMVKVSK